MNDRDYVHKAVELADGWRYGPGPEIVRTPTGEITTIGCLPQWFLDALAAQLVRQVRAVPDRGVYLWIDLCRDIRRIAMCDDVATGIIKTIVDSSVLEKAETR